MTWLTNFTIYTVLEVEPVGCKYTNAVKDEATPTSQVSLDEDGDLVITWHNSKLLLTSWYGILSQYVVTLYADLGYHGYSLLSQTANIIFCS